MLVVNGAQVEQHGGVVRHLAQMLEISSASAKCPRLQVISANRDSESPWSGFQHQRLLQEAGGPGCIARPVSMKRIPKEIPGLSCAALLCDSARRCFNTCFRRA